MGWALCLLYVAFVLEPTVYVAFVPEPTGYQNPSSGDTTTSTVLGSVRIYSTISYELPNSRALLHVDTGINAFLHRDGSFRGRCQSLHCVFGLLLSDAMRSWRREGGRRSVRRLQKVQYYVRTVDGRLQIFIVFRNWRIWRECLTQHQCAQRLVESLVESSKRFLIISHLRIIAFSFLQYDTSHTSRLPTTLAVTGTNLYKSTVERT
jgi:hypothetical protein